jgi:hypothetical protein
MTALTASRPSGEMRVHDGARHEAQHHHDERGVHQHPTRLQAQGRHLPASSASVIQLSVPSSVVASGIMMKQQEDEERLAQGLHVEAVAARDHGDNRNLRGERQFKDAADLDA